MGVKATFGIKRNLALEIIKSKIDNCTNEQLGEILEEFEESELRNYDVVDEFPEDCNPERNPFRITSFREFNNG